MLKRFLCFFLCGLLLTAMGCGKKEADNILFDGTIADIILTDTDISSEGELDSKEAILALWEQLDAGTREDLLQRLDQEFSNGVLEVIVHFSDEVSCRFMPEDEDTDTFLLRADAEAEPWTVTRQELSD